MKLRLASAVLAAALAIAPRAARAEPPVEYAARHILLAYRGATRSNQTRTREEAKALATKAAEAIRGGRSFADASHEWSDDKVSDRRGGFLGFFPAEQMDARFSAAVAAAKPGEVVGPVESDFGFHVIERLSNDAAVAILGAEVAVVRGAYFAWKGCQGAQDGRSKEQALDDASRAITALTAARDFAALRPEIGALPFPKPDYMAEVLRHGGIRPEFAAVEAEAFALKVGDLSTKPVESPIGWIVLERLPFFHMHIEHLIVLHKDAPNGAGRGVTRTKAEAKTRAAEALAKIKADPASWPKVVAEYSDEPQAGARQGSLGGVEPGSMVPDFERAFVRLAPGAFSELVETPFGWHVIRRVD